MNVEKFQTKTLPILPTVYDESLSYYESVGKLGAKVNELVDFINGMKLDVFNDCKAYADSAIAELEGRVAEAVRGVEQIQADLLLQYEKFANDTGVRIKEFDERLVEMSNRINAIVESVNARTDLVIQKNNEYIFKLFEENVMGMITVQNYFTGDVVSVQDMFNYLATLHLENALTYAVLIVKELTYDYLANKGLSYTSLVRNGGTLL